MMENSVRRSRLRVTRAGLESPSEVLYFLDSVYDILAVDRGHSTMKKTWRNGNGGSNFTKIEETVENEGKGNPESCGDERDERCN